MNGVLRPNRFAALGGVAERGHFQSAPKRQLLEHVVDVTLHRMHRNVHSRGNFLVAQPLPKQLDDFLLPRREQHSLKDDRRIDGSDVADDLGKE